MDIKVCNLRSVNFENDLFASLVDTGFAVVTHHGIDFGLIREAQQSWRNFFLSENANKTQFINVTDSNMGYKGFKSEKAVGATSPDLKEFFHWKPGKKIPIQVSSLTMQLFYQLEDVAGQVLNVLDRKTESHYKDDCESSDNTILRTLYYPALDFTQETNSVRAAAHQDINHITLLIAASAPGLEVLDNNGIWHSVPHENNSIVVNVGDMLQLASNGLFKSTTHRVVNPDSSTDRISMPLFIHPQSHTLLAPGVTAQSYLNERLKEIYIKGIQ